MKISFLVVIALSALAAAQAGAGAQPKKNQWQSLFDGETLAGWTDGKGEAVEEGNWVAEDGVLTRKSRGSGSLFSSRDYRDFEFSFEWKISKNGNSGVKYRLAKFDGKWLGLEYQILDDQGHPDAKNGPIRQTAALYDLKPASKSKPMRTVEEWNQSLISVKEEVVTHSLNGEIVMQLKIPSEEWSKRLNQSKYSQLDAFGLNKHGPLQLQDHNDAVSYRNLRIREF